jgi:glycerol kinase
MARSINSAITLDLGTTSIKAALLNQNGSLYNIVSQAAPEIKADHGYYESDALHYAETTEQVLAKCQAQAGKNLPLGLCSQRSSFLIWEKASGQPFTSLISWQDNRGIACCEAMWASENIIHEATGLRLTPYYFAPKLNVLLQLNPEWRDRLINGELIVGTLDSFLIWRWTSGQFHVMDASMAARTLLMDIRSLQWSSDLCERFGIPLAILPQIMPSAGLGLHLDNGLVLQASLGDQSAALVASILEDQSEALVNLGTGGFVMRYQVTDESMLDGYLRTLVYLDSIGHSHIANEGTLNSISAALASYPVDQCRVEELGENDVFCLAEPNGIGAPYFRNDLGIYFSQSIEHLTNNQVAALLLEAIIFRVARILEDFHGVSPVKHVFLSGGLSALSCLQHGIAQCVPYQVSRLQQKEASLQGAAMLAAGLRLKHHWDVKKIVVVSRNIALHEKYQHWKIWLDALLQRCSDYADR